MRGISLIEISGMRQNFCGGLCHYARRTLRLLLVGGRGFTLGLLAMAPGARGVPLHLER